MADSAESTQSVPVPRASKPVSETLLNEKVRSSGPGPTWHGKEEEPWNLDRGRRIWLTDTLNWAFSGTAQSPPCLFDPPLALDLALYFRFCYSSDEHGPHG